MRWWLVPADEVPADREARIDWLFTWWGTIDDWISRRQDETRAAREPDADPDASRAAAG
jgi:hypothetical protein